MIKIDVKYIWAKRLNSILKTWFFTTVQTFKLDFLENMKSADTIHAVDNTFAFTCTIIAFRFCDLDLHVHS